MDINMLQFRAYDKQEKIMFKSVGNIYEPR